MTYANYRFLVSKSDSLVLLLLSCLVLANAATINVALNKPVTLNGAFPVYTYPGGPLCGIDPPNPLR